MVSALIVFCRILAVTALCLYAASLWAAALGTPGGLPPEIETGGLFLWSVALWFLYIALRFGNHASNTRLFRRASKFTGRILISAFGAIALITVIYAVSPTLAAFNLSEPAAWAPLVQPLAIGLSGLFAIMVLTAGRGVADREMRLNEDGRLVIAPGTRLNLQQAVQTAGLAPRYPYRG